MIAPISLVRGSEKGFMHLRQAVETVLPTSVVLCVRLEARQTLQSPGTSHIAHWPCHEIAHFASFEQQPSEMEVRISRAPV